MAIPQQLPVITQSALIASALDATQFVQNPVVSISDAPPAVRGDYAFFKLTLLDSDTPVRVRMHGMRAPDSIIDVPVGADDDDISVPSSDYLMFNQIILVDGDVIVQVPTTGGTPPFDDPEYFEMFIDGIDPCYIVRAHAVGIIVSAIGLHVYDAGVYETDPLDSSNNTYQ